MTIDKEQSPLAVVTGASSGIGFELAKQFAGHGYDLVIAAEDDELLDATEKLLEVGRGPRNPGQGRPLDVMKGDSKVVSGGLATKTKPGSADHG